MCVCVRVCVCGAGAINLKAILEKNTGNASATVTPRETPYPAAQMNALNNKTVNTAGKTPVQAKSPFSYLTTPRTRTGASPSSTEAAVSLPNKVRYPSHMCDASCIYV